MDKLRLAPNLGTTMLLLFWVRDKEIVISFKLLHVKANRVPLTSRRSNQSILKEINSEYSLGGLMLKLKLQSFGHLVWKSQLTGKDPDAGKDWRQEENSATEEEMVGWHH